MADLKKIIESMSDDVRAKAQAYANSKGISLEEAVSQQLNNELSDEDLESIAGGRAALIPVEAPVEADIEKDVL